MVDLGRAAGGDFSFRHARSRLFHADSAGLPEVHRRFAVAQNFFIGATIAFCGMVSLFFAPELVGGSIAARIICAGIALWWGGRLIVLQWLGVQPHLANSCLKLGFGLLQVECATYAVAYGWLAAGRH